ncbi:hypothetical protein [Trabulsiella odontotermitis]|uniref:hypothetical protein n=1 Tax=Trabulsiella odontotermitis TaxID=379893 RepID=UPI0006BA2973|nr:hypothetical protein [Trabulsiella odontotermitis]
MRLSQSVIERLLKIKWFSAVGKETSMPNVMLAMSLDEAQDFLADPQWENVTLEEANAISGYLATKHVTILQEWNDVAKEAKVYFDNDISPKIPQLNDFDNLLLRQCVEWDVMHYLIEDFYSKKLTSPLFFNRLLSIYESGHIPCGWQGNWPKGQLVVY